MSKQDVQETTHFGYEQVPVTDKASKVADVFHSVADKYDIMNDLMSAGVHRLWKRYTIETSGAKKGDTILDLAGGTGDLAAKFTRIVGPNGLVTLSDINGSMLENGRQRLTNMGIAGNIEYVQANAECLPFADNKYDLITIAFGLRNVTDKDAALKSMYRVLKPGGKLMILEFSKPVVPGLSTIYDQYSFKLLPLIGKVVANDEDSYRYLAESIRMHPDQETLKGMMDEAGFERTSYHNMTGGVVALHTGYKF
ncbi:bifunctional demethylmenaquinone methyltransferase/2-methoxy-6-polyprenyl-1,4-benzoquinol methylase UbiE [Cocleimonas sp. KMM 6892]|uniref:bifunctional demethylmenaquinone methyltransferase/2-methoxy-6-polyprenyl-1,4-benzoquinol methylase UbiE n=1 Tax=unclassified Cocleimonas TaxID=2639732 RepID=UPI002DBF2671|nr:MULTISPECIES: bifunctional demethylmenaquinone methyltransferase/2-methoxy-6-polyprenyl-1,4-benzoquinol methylase UbiE [unclassified Cocleimonas]MEB8431776.1 bifunctional demethylmenaquinone methyltransferase/2-methoxy-6-polyprenyl-1,4-benzoquinol methylase UbiE [Cocleimonas sp. KMM 6892]MEC4715138.1 bifunctional demethylmenaquinone methyltransferase/2-methoxy-6-polyprenyl-1,4-benzoquinol methylase UbiE [Cocleimonas sp. KMM 6895]MEC4744048.1 bifunctional demethylmenaquinone methyltransferase/